MTDVKKNVLIAGARGMLGRRVVEACRPEWNTVGVDLEEFDITSLKETLAFVVPQKPDLVINCAAMTDVDGCESRFDEAYRINGIGAGNLARAASESGAEIIQISTDYVFDGEFRGEYLEEHPVNPVSAYGRTKLAGERFARSNNPRCWIVRTQWLYGPQGKNFVDTILQAAKERKVLHVVNDQIGSPTFSKDLAEQVVRIAALRPPYGIYHCSNNGACSWFDFTRRILECAGIKDVKVQPMTSDQLNRPAKRPAHSVLKNYHLMLTIGDGMRPWEEALKDFFRLTMGREQSGSA